MSDDQERKALLSPSAPSYNDQLPSYQESVGTQNTVPGRTTGEGFQSMSFSTSPPPLATHYQPGYQTMPYIQTQVILVGGCPTCRYYFSGPLIKNLRIIFILIIFTS